MLSESLELQWLCKVNKHQLSDLIFLDEEVSFLKSLLDKYFSEKLPEVHVNRVQLIGEQLVHLNILKENITKDALTHQGNLHSQINNLLSKGVESLKLQNHRIEDEIRDLNKCFKNIKRDIFTIFKTTGIEEYQH
jgi:archaellum component FlaC